jgi:aldose 1-epimerase
MQPVDHKVVALRCGAAECLIFPGIGACVGSLCAAGSPILRPAAPNLASPRQSGCFALLPYSNRIAHGRFKWDEHAYQLALNDRTEPHPIHGVGWSRPWEVQEQTRVSATMTLHHRPDTHWPFEFRADLRYILAPDMLLMDLRLRNLSSSSMPAGLGFHPYFPKDAGCRLSLGATSRWINDDQHLPRERIASTGLHMNVDELDLADCFEGWPGEVLLQTRHLELVIRSELQRVIIFTRPRLPFVAIEPVSHLSNALAAPFSEQRAQGIESLRQGEEMRATTSISWKLRH